MDRGTVNKTAPRRTARELVDVGAETGAVVLVQKLKIIARTVDPAQHRNPTEAFRALEIANVVTLEKTNNKPNSAVMKRDGNPYEIPSVAAELL